MKKRIGMAVLLLAAFTIPAFAGSLNGTLYFTTFSGGENVWKVSFTYNGSSTFTLGSPTNITSTSGADGLLFLPDGNLAVAGQGFNLSEVNPSGSGASAIVGTVNPGDPAFHLALNASGTLLYSMWNGGGGAQIAATPLTGGALSVGGTAYTVSLAPGTTGSTDVRGIIFDPTNGKWYYGTACDGCSGDFGTLVFNDTTHTATLTPLMSGVFAHGLTFDPYTNDIIFSSAGTVSQYDPTCNCIVGSIIGAGNFDQSAVDGNGDLFVASNGGGLFFINYAATKNIGSATFSTEPFLAGSLDDIAPIAGIGGGGQTPEPASLALLASGLAAVGIRVRRRK